MSNNQNPRKRLSWEAITALATVAGVVVAAVAIIIARANNSPTDSHPSAAPTSQSHQATSTNTQASTPTGEPASHLFKDIVLRQHAGVDIDGAAPVVTQGLGGIVGDNDVYHDSTPVSSNSLITPEGLYVYTGNPARAYQECTAYFADTTHTLDKGSGFYIGRPFCFHTSEGRLAFLQLTATEGSPGIYTSATFNVRVWDK